VQRASALFETLCLKHLGVMILPFFSDVTDHVSNSIELNNVVSYGWSIVTNPLSHHCWDMTS